MVPNPILKVLSTFRKYKVKGLLIGGQACIIYGAAEFSRDSDFLVLCEERNLIQVQKALNALKAEPVYFPHFDSSFLERGHACHFRCRAKGVEGLRVDILSKLRGCDGFDALWKRRKTVRLLQKESIEIIGLHDLVQCKKTQRDKDWLMLKRLIDNDILLNKNKRPDKARIRWWFLECRTADVLIAIAKKYPAVAGTCVPHRPLLAPAILHNPEKLNAALREEEIIERQKDIVYWSPLKKELETLRLQRSASHR